MSPVTIQPIVSIDPIPTGADGVARGATITVTGTADCIVSTIDPDGNPTPESSPESISEVAVCFGASGTFVRATPTGPVSDITGQATWTTWTTGPLTVTSVVNDGLQIVARVSAGPRTRTKTVSVTVDRTAPILVLTTPDEMTQAAVSGKAAFVVAGTARDDRSPVAAVEWTLGQGTTFTPATPKAPGDWSSWTIAVEVAPGNTYQLLVRARDGEGNITPAKQVMVRAVTPQALCPSNVPLVLLPVRLETRFFTLPGNVTELRVRIYPDKIHVDTHEPELTTDERTSGTAYWQQDWAAATDTVARANAWRTLAGRFGATRAAWIARLLQPTNLLQRPKTPVPVGQSPAVAPVFPTLPPVDRDGGESAWRRAPQARLLPDRWVAVVHARGQAELAVTGRDITRPLAVGPNPRAPQPDEVTKAAIRSGDALALDPGMAWMVDFDAAEAVGMALRITIPPAVLAAGIESLLVFGVAASLGAANTSSQLADLLDAHHYTDGLEFLRYGTPTNNTDDRRAGYSSADPDHARSFASEVVADPNGAPNATRVGTALGLSTNRIAPTLGRVAQARQDHERDLRSMNTALWPVGWGYFLGNMMGAETGLTTASIDWARGHFVNYVRAGGPLPAMRCGVQPYGILPVTSLDLWTSGGGEPVAPQEIWLKSFLINARDKVWRPVVGHVARVGLRQAPPDPDADLADVMRTDGVSSGALTRGVVGRHYVEHLLTLVGQDPRGAVSMQNTVAALMLQLLGLPTQPAQVPRLARGFFADVTSPLTAPLVQAGEISPWQSLAPNYIARLLAAPTIQALIDARPSPAATNRATSFLEMLLRHAMLREIANAAARIAATVPGSNLAALLRDLELVDLVDVAIVNRTVLPPPATFHWKRQLDTKVPAITGTGTIRQFLEGLTSFTAPAVTSLGEFRASLAHLQGLDTESLQFLMQSTLDLSAHRLDAWITSFATKRLSTMTAAAPVGQYVGGYGWVENLAPAAPAAAVPPASLPAGEQGPLIAPPRDSGFIHAPSLTHASAAALLRNAHLGATGVPQANDPFAIDISSRRVREASRLLDGVRQGQPLGALLGYRFERRLHDLNLDRFIAPLRDVAPLAVRERENTTLPVEALAASNVVDALVLLRRWQEDRASVAGALNGATPAQAGQIANELAALAESVDGLSDALTAEVAYQVARGNPTRLATTLSSIARGEGMPPELEVAHMPRTGTSITHRVLALTSGAPQLAAGWTGSSVLANSERMLNAWISKLLVDPRKVRCTVERLDAGSGAVVETITFPLSEVTVTAIDFIYGVKPTGDSREPSPSTIEQLVLYQARRRPGGFGAAASLRLNHARPANLGVGERTLFDELEQGRAIGRLLENARGVRPDDLCPPERRSAATIDLVDLDTRVVRAENGLNAAHKGLALKVPAGTATPAEDLRTCLMALVPFDLGPAVPCIAVGDTPEIRSALLRQAVSLLKISGARLDEGAALRTQPLATEERVRCDQLLARARAVFGARFVMLPIFSADTKSATELWNALGASTQVQGGDPLASHGWFTRTARVRENLARFGACLRGAEVLGAAERLALAVAQLPFDSAAPARWVGLPPLPGTELSPGKLSLVVQSPVTINTSVALSGVFVDEWVEVVPNKSETTALAFQFDPPNAFAPQNVLVAVPPIPGQDWTTETLRRTLVETLDLAKLRGVDSSLLGAAAQYLPALYMPFNAADDAVSTDFVPLTA